MFLLIFFLVIEIFKENKTLLLPTEFKAIAALFLQVLGKMWFGRLPSLPRRILQIQIIRIRQFPPSSATSVQSLHDPNQYMPLPV